MAQTRQARLAQLKSLLDALPNSFPTSTINLSNFRVDPGEMNDDGYAVAVRQDSAFLRSMLADGEGAVRLARRVSGRKNREDLSPLARCALYT